MFKFKRAGAKKRRSIPKRSYYNYNHVIDELNDPNRDIFSELVISNNVDDSNNLTDNLMTQSLTSSSSSSSSSTPTAVTTTTTTVAVPEITNDCIPKTYTSMPKNINFDLSAMLLSPKLPMLAKPIDFKTFSMPNRWIYEEKYDGERMIVAAFDSERKYCYTRTLKQSHIFKHEIILQSNINNCIFDGELVYVDQNDEVISICDTGNRNALKIQYRIFDIQYMNGTYIGYYPLCLRKAYIEECIVETPNVVISKYYQCVDIENVMDKFKTVVDKGGEGLILKEINGSYSPNERIWLKVKALHMIEHKDEFELYAHRLRKDKNNVPNILECGFYKIINNNEIYIHVTNVSSGINYNMRTKLKLLTDPITGLFLTKTIVSLTADKITTYKSLRHPSLLRIRNDLDDIDISRFV